ncbi:ATP-dependent helicase protein [Rhizobium phage RHph_I46]|uniref:ATP-dependent helicase protein n=1 Tax=Rhizobium phage RHph_I1_9 TaxID=2509729 RepID=A0A7S5UWN2_9CAUD|nr:ATP-dependent helicase protein [Rhizobium phage RHph_I1_9]QIG69603.1 ATP-dependent helicase protein [Rhizobium phage RHph_I46]QIG70884.1 ATP-dependent helicase protein [Rhizobium phage RHph_I9]QIG73470.1 ATP-dependent helicase protein [Rhizobium phage RHph_I1_9]QIG76223.1 ATP-dependent helicase protein [Rhizobium phage RHph_I34]
MFEYNEALIKQHFPYEIIRDPQYEAIVKTLDAYKDGYKHVILEAPTGVGKSAVGLTVGRILNQVISTQETPHKTCFTTITKYLQGQYRRDFPFLKDIRNAADEMYMCSEQTTKQTEQCILHRNKVEDACKKTCPYQLALMAFRRGPLSITNAHFFGLAPFRYNLAIFDECHELSNVVASQAELKMTNIDVSKLSLIFRADTDEVMKLWSQVPKFINGIKDKAVFDFIDTSFLADINMDEYQERVDALAGQPEFRSTNFEFRKFKNNVAKAMFISESKMVKVIENDETFVRPIYAREFAPSMFFTKADRFLHMSATICGFEGYTRELGFEKSDWIGIEIGHAIDVDRRKIYFQPVSWMSAKNEEKDIERSVAFIDQKIDQYEGVNTIIHSASYKRAEKFKELSKHQIHVPRSAALAIDYLSAQKKEQFVSSPSLVAGVDGKDDLCRLNILAKVPYPSFGDPRIQYIAKHNPEMLNQGIIRTMVQASGRGTRHENDYSDTYIIDGCFERLLNDWPSYFPKWFMDALEKQ